MLTLRSILRVKPEATRLLSRALLTLSLATLSSTAFAQLDAVIVEAESGVLGSEFTTGVDGTTTYVTPTTTGGGQNPANVNRVITFGVTFPHDGAWELYGRVYVGPATFNDDSFYYANGFGTKDPALDTDWITVNGLAAAVGYTLPGDKVVVGGPATSQVWKWVKLSAFDGGEPPLASFPVPPGNLTQTFQIGAREDGLRIDKLAFGPQGVFFTVFQLDNGLPGNTEPPPPPYVPPGPPIATGNSKFLGSVYSTSQIVNFDAYFNQITPENGGKWGSVEATRDVMVWTEVDAAYAWAQSRNIPIRFHTLVWGAQQPAWIESLPPSEQFVEIVEWFSAVAARYPDIDFIDVVNEPLHDPPDGPGDGNYIAALGGAGTTGWDWVINAFALARAFFPNARLGLNEYSVTNDPPVMANYITIIQLLQAQGLIDVVGIQGHAFSTRGDEAEITSSLDLLFSSTSLPVHITELDIDGPTDEVQLADYQRIFPAFWEHPSVEGITLWGYRPGMWRTPQGAYLVHQNGAERPSMLWLLGYVNPCLAINPTTVAVPEEGVVSDTVAVTATAAPGCSPMNWTAVSNNTWIAITGGASGTDDGTVTYSVDANTGGVRTGTATIAGSTFTVNQASLPSLAIDDVGVAEGDGGGTPATFTVTLSAPTNRTVTVAYATADGTAVAPGDYTAATGTLTFDPLVTSQTISVTVNGDLLDEPDETFSVSLSSPANALIGQGLGAGTIVDDDATPSLVIGDVSVAEGNSGNTPAVFTVTLSAPSGQLVTVGFETQDGTATAGLDYDDQIGTLTFDPGQTTQTIAIDVIGDTEDEPDETFTVLLSGATNASVADALGAGTILDDEDALMLPAALSLDPLSQGVWQEGETVTVAPSWRNDGAGASGDMTGAATASNGGTVVDGTASYGIVPIAGTASCTASGDCYSVTASGPRPAGGHWDVMLTETVSEGPSHGWLLHVGDSFSDMPRSSPFFRFVETLLHKGVTGGCGPGSYCGTSPTSREQMPIFALLGKEGAGYSPPACGATPMFNDVPVSSPFCRWVEEFARRGITGGCGGGNYCPTSPVSREQMALFVLRTLDPALSPPACASPNLFNDVPETSPFCRWIEELANRGVVSGCGGGNYCPTDPVTREQMAVFITSTFGLTLYGP